MSATGGGNMMTAEIHVDGASVTAGVPHMLFSSGYAATVHPGLPPSNYNPYAVSADGQRFLVPQFGAAASGDGDTADQLAQIADRGGLAPYIASLSGTNLATPITIVLNWPTILKRK